MKAGSSPVIRQSSGLICWRAVLSGLFFSIAFALSVCFVLAIIVFTTQISTLLGKYIAYILNGLCMISILLGGAYAAYRAQEGGWINGTLVGAGFVLLSFFLGLILSPGLISIKVLLLKIGGGLLAGCIGGIIGINL